jgi:hypothetical protein
MALLLVLVVPPPHNQIETSRGLRLLYVHESHAREPKPPLVGIERRTFGSQITAWGNSESRRQSRDQTPTQVLIRDVDLPLRKPAYVP